MRAISVSNTFPQFLQVCSTLLSFQQFPSVLGCADFQFPTEVSLAGTGRLVGRQFLLRRVSVVGELPFAVRTDEGYHHSWNPPQFTRKVANSATFFSSNG